MSAAATDTARAILFALSEGRTTKQILADYPEVTPVDIQAAAADALRMLEAGETREDRIARVRRFHPHAFEPWSDVEDAQLREEFLAGASIAALSRAFGRPGGAVRMRLEKLGVEWRRDGRPRKADG